MCVYTSFQSSYKVYLFVFKVGCKKNFVSKFHTILFYVHHSVGKISEYLICGTKYFIFKVIGDMRSNPLGLLYLLLFQERKLNIFFWTNTVKFEISKSMTVHTYMYFDYNKLLSVNIDRCFIPP